MSGLFQAAVLEIECAGGLGGGTAEVSDGAGAPLAASDREGDITDPGGAVLLRAPLRFDGRSDRGTNAVLDVAGPDGEPLGEVRVRKYSVSPRSRKATLSVRVGDAEAARLQSEDEETVAITAGGRPAGTLRKTGKMGLFRRRTSYRLELTGDLAEALRQLVVAAAIRYDHLVTEASDAGLGR